MPDTLALLYTPLGQPGSGRVRYGAAMALWREGAISAEVLEVYRIASAHDAQNPLEALRDCGLPLPAPPPERDAVRALYTIARDYLLALDHPGAAEVRAGLPADPGLQRIFSNRRNNVVDQFLAPALAALKAAQPHLAEAIATAAPQLPWASYDAYPRDLIGDAFATGHAFASLIGGDAPFAAHDFDAGLFLIAPQVLYRDHCHAAPELYAPLTGPHGWRFGPGRPLIIKPAHQPVWNPAFQPHLTKVGAVPFLCLFVWTRDVDAIADVLPANDWRELEVTAIG
jgi:Dimethlysulfonioproprionate lyase